MALLNRCWGRDGHLALMHQRGAEDAPSGEHDDLPCKQELQRASKRRQQISDLKRTYLRIGTKLSYIFKDPNFHDPYRFGPGREEDKVGGRFSVHPIYCREARCLGEDYAYMQIKVIWSYLLRNFELKMISPLIPGRWMGKIHSRAERWSNGYIRCACWNDY